MLGAHQVFPIVPPRYALRCDFQAIVFLVPHVHTGNMGIYNIYIYIYNMELPRWHSFWHGNDRSTCTAWGSSEAFVCLFVAVFLLFRWFHQFWGVGLTDPLTPA